MNSILVIGMGRFGSSLATELYDLGNEVCILDNDEEKIDDFKDMVTQAVTGDARDTEVLKSVGARNFDCAVVACGSDVGNSALITLNLKDMQVPKVVAKANSQVHQKVLDKIGADLVVVPEKEMAVKLANKLTNNNMLEFIELSDEFSIAEIRIPASWAGKSIIELNIRAKFKVNVLAVRSEGEPLSIDLGGSYIFKKTDNLLVLGDNDPIARLEGLK